jgi:hypothetical protein
MHISPNKVVTVHSILSESMQNTYDTSKATVYLYGRFQITVTKPNSAIN